MTHLDEIENDKVYQYAYTLRTNGKNVEEITQELIWQGIDEKDAKTVSGDISKYYVELTFRSGKRNILYGAILGIAGMLTTIVANNYNTNSNIGYLVAWGMIGLGAIKLIRGVVQRTRVDNKVKNYPLK
jgi:hypothetical protein